MKFKEITVRGTPYERGFTYGQLCREEVAMSMKGYEVLYEGTKGISWEEARKISEYYLSLIRDFEPAYVEEMQGIADGAGVDLQDIAALNIRTEIMYAQPSMIDASACTCISAMAPATEGGRVLAAQNWDYTRLVRDAVVIVHVYQEDKPNFVMVVEGAGMIGGIGMNDCGVAVTLNALKTTAPCNGIPFEVRLRAMLEAENLSEAYVQGSHAPTSVGNFIATHKDGVAIDFEMDARGVEPIIPDDGVLLHMNHYLGPKMYFANDVNHMGSSYIRLQRMQAMVKECHGKITVEDIKRMLSDHAGYPYSICDHEDPKYPVAVRDDTNFAIIMDLTENCMHLAYGNPCENAFDKYYI